MKPTERVMLLVERFGGIDGEHHKQWLIDQMVRVLLGEDEYRAWVNEYNSEPDYPPWNCGIAP